MSIRSVVQKGRSAVSFRSRIVDQKCRSEVCIRSVGQKCRSEVCSEVSIIEVWTVWRERERERGREREREREESEESEEREREREKARERRSEVSI